MFKPEEITTRGLTPDETQEVAFVMALHRARAEAAGYSVPHLRRLEHRLRDLAGLPTNCEEALTVGPVAVS